MLYSYIKESAGGRIEVVIRRDPHNVLQNAITYLCFKAKTLSQTKVMKLIYLADVYHMERYGSRLTEAPFKCWYYGPFSEEVDSEIEHLCGAGILKQELYQTRSGHTAEIPKPHINKTRVELSEEAVCILDEIIDEWGDSSTEDVVAYAKTSLPFIGTPFGKQIDFSRTDLVKEIAKEKNISIEDAATMLVENNEGLMKSLDRAIEKVKAQSLP